MLARLLAFAVAFMTLVAHDALADEPTASSAVDLAHDVLPLLKTRCVKCHGPAKQEGKLRLSSARSLARGGEDGAIVVPGKPDASLLWEKIDGEEMPPDDPLPQQEREVLRRWIEQGAQGLPAIDPADTSSDHWSFRPLASEPPSDAKDGAACRTPVDRFIAAELEQRGLHFQTEAERRTLIRRVALDLVGVPPSPAEIEAFLSDVAPDAYEQMVERYLASPHYGERWGKYWLDAAGYADSNGYFQADTDRPLAYRYRDYVVKSFNDDKPLDVFVREQLAGDELSAFVPSQPASSEMLDKLVATHYLRNGQDGSGESDGNSEELRIDRYTALESTQQIVVSSLLGLTIQCAKCHDHKFEPISQREYYELQAIFYPAYPAYDLDRWTKPNERFVYANLPGEIEAWEASQQRIEAELTQRKSDFHRWVNEHRQRGEPMFADDFTSELGARWSHTAPGDDAPGGTPAVKVGGSKAPAAKLVGGHLQVIESGAEGDRLLSTQQVFDWTPDNTGDWVQATFELVDNNVGKSQPAERIGYLIALHDFNDNGSTSRGNILIDGNPTGGAGVYVDYPGADSQLVGEVGAGKYEPGHVYGVRITNIGDGKYKLEHVIDWVPEERGIELTAEDLPDGGFGFEYCCGRSFVVDNVLVERGSSGASAADGSFQKQLAAQRDELAANIKKLESQRTEKPGKVSWLTDISPDPPATHLLQRGNYTAPGEPVQPGVIAALTEPGDRYQVQAPPNGLSTGRRLSLANWITRPGSPAAALMARVQANRIWQYHFGTGLVATPENLGYSGSPPSHPELLNYLAFRLVESGWSIKSLHRLIMTSAAYRQSSKLDATALAVDADNRLLWRYPMRRLDAEAVRDATLAVSGELDLTLGGPYVPTKRDGLGETIVEPGHSGAKRRSIYLYQRRTQVLSMLGVFDSPSIVFNCVQRVPSTVPLQSLGLLNSQFAIDRATAFSARVTKEAGAERSGQIEYGFLLAFGRPPTDVERASAERFLTEQPAQYGEGSNREQLVLRDFFQMLLASNAFLYVD